MHPRSRFLFVLGVALAIAALASTAALGHAVKRFDSRVTLAKANPFHGHVSSPKHACEVNRTVKVFQARNDGLFDKTKTDSDGKWSIPSPTVNGKFYAKVTRRKEGAAGTIFVCRPDLSPTRSFGGGGGY